MLKQLVEQFRNLPTWQKYFILLILPVLSSVYLWISFILPLREEVSKLKFEKQQEEKALEKLESYLYEDTLKTLQAQEETLKQQLMTKEQELIQIAGSIPTERDLGKIVNFINTLAKRSGVSILNIKLNPPQEVTYVIEVVNGSKVVKEISVQTVTQQTPTQQQQIPQQTVEGVKYYKVETFISLLGRFNNIKAFLEGLSKSFFVSYPLSISMKKTEDNLIQADLTIALSLRKEE